jgi:hypothetical protein
MCVWFGSRRKERELYSIKLKTGLLIDRFRYWLPESTPRNCGASDQLMNSVQRLQFVLVHLLD